MRRLPDGSTVGVLGGGQLGRMLALAAARLGFDVHVFSPEEDSPAARVAARNTVAAYDDLEAVAAFARDCDVVTYEFENVPAPTAEAAFAHASVRPHPRALAVAQDRLAEKRFAKDIGAEPAAHEGVDTLDQLDAALIRLGTPARLKRRREGYDGKGQAVIAAPSDAEAAWTAIGPTPAVLEGEVRFVREVSAIAARAVDGAVAHFPLTENDHESGVLRRSEAPAPDPRGVEPQARRIAEAMLEALDYVGVLTVEFFETSDGRLLVNEIAPRVHNSGHWTLDAAVTDQFTQHIRAITGFPLGDTAPLCRAVMENALGPEGRAVVEAAVGDPSAAVHLYGKRAWRSGRKMGHVTRRYVNGHKQTQE